jgi:hypothetical protein
MVFHYVDFCLRTNFGKRYDLGPHPARKPECDLELAIDSTLAIYAGYVSASRKAG